MSAENFNHSEKLYDVLVVGGGPAGLNAALYASRKGFDVIVLSIMTGGQLNYTALIENYLGCNSIHGYELADRFRSHVEDYKIPIVETSNVTAYHQIGKNHEVTLSDGSVYKGKTMIVATGSVYRNLNVPGEWEFAGKGVSYCAICDAPLYRNKDVIVVGGGNSAVEAAIDLSKYATSVTLLHRSNFRADKVLLDTMESDPKITYRLRIVITEVFGDEFMEGVKTINLDTKEEKVFKGQGLFIEIGHDPNTGPFKDALILSDTGAVMTDGQMVTNVPGVFAAGNVRDFPYKQIVIAASEGAIAALSAADYLIQKY
jgi:NADH-dependent peroxiredoxin subunit F